MGSFWFQLNGLCVDGRLVARLAVALIGLALCQTETVGVEP